MKTYRGTPESEHWQKTGTITVEEPGRPTRVLDPRLDLANHSPTGFAWAYLGSGPAQTALAILADALPADELALHFYQRYKFEVIGRLPEGAWTITEQQVLDWAGTREVGP